MSKIEIRTNKGECHHLVSRNPAKVGAALDRLLGGQPLHLDEVVRHCGHPRHVGGRHLIEHITFHFKIYFTNDAFYIYICHLISKMLALNSLGSQCKWYILSSLIQICTKYRTLSWWLLR